jgi:hypothetical protein
MVAEDSGRRVDAAGREWPAAEALLADWVHRARVSQFCHYEAAKHFGWIHYAIGVPVIVFTCLVGTAVYATLQKSVTVPVQVAVGTISVLAAILAGLQTFLRFGERSEKHRAIGAQYGSVRRRIEVVRALLPERRGAVDDFLNRLRETLDSLAESAPDVPPRVWKRAEENFRRQNKSTA